MNDDVYMVELPSDYGPEEECADLHKALLVLLSGRKWPVVLTACLNVVVSGLDRKDLTPDQMHWFLSRLDAFVAIAMRAHEASHDRAADACTGPQQTPDDDEDMAPSAPGKPVVH